MAVHMGSAKYFHPAELEITSHTDVKHMAPELNKSGRACNAFVLSFVPAGLERDHQRGGCETGNDRNSYKVGKSL